MPAQSRYFDEFGHFSGSIELWEEFGSSSQWAQIIQWVENEIEACRLEMENETNYSKLMRLQGAIQELAKIADLPTKVVEQVNYKKRLEKDERERQRANRQS